MALFREQDPLEQVSGNVPMGAALSRGQRTKLALLGYKPTGEQTAWGKLLKWVPGAGAITGGLATTTARGTTAEAGARKGFEQRLKIAGAQAALLGGGLAGVGPLAGIGGGAGTVGAAGTTAAGTAGATAAGTVAGGPAAGIAQAALTGAARTGATAVGQGAMGAAGGMTGMERAVKGISDIQEAVGGVSDIMQTGRQLFGPGYGEEEARAEMASFYGKGGGKISVSKAKKILKDGSIKGEPLTDKQKRFFGFIAGGGTPTKMQKGGYVSKQVGGVSEGPLHAEGGIDMIDSQTGRKVGELEDNERIFSREDTTRMEMLAKGGKYNALGKMVAASIKKQDKNQDNYAQEGASVKELRGKLQELREARERTKVASEAEIASKLELAQPGGEAAMRAAKEHIEGRRGKWEGDLDKMLSVIEKDLAAGNIDVVGDKIDAYEEMLANYQYASDPSSYKINRISGELQWADDQRIGDVKHISDPFFRNRRQAAVDISAAGEAAGRVTDAEDFRFYEYPGIEARPAVGVAEEVAEPTEIPERIEPKRVVGIEPEEPALPKPEEVEALRRVEVKASENLARVQQPSLFDKMGGIGGLAQLAQFGIGLAGATRPLPTFEGAGRWDEFVERAERESYMGLSPEEKGLYRQASERTYAYDIANVRAAAGGAGAVALANLGRAASSKYQSDLRMAAMDEAVRRQNFQYYGNVASKDLAFRERMFARDYQGAVASKQSASELARTGLQGFIDTIDYQKAYGPGSIYAETREAELGRIREETGLLRLMKGAYAEQVSPAPEVRPETGPRARYETNPVTESIGLGDELETPEDVSAFWRMQGVDVGY